MALGEFQGQMKTPVSKDKSSEPWYYYSSEQHILLGS